MDFIFNTNRENLLLGSIGPVGLLSSPAEPSVRFLQSLFLLSTSEDEEAQGLRVRLFMGKAKANCLELKDAFPDCSFYMAQ